jgi:glycosyltransferase involved in cell wall biosynthesis
MTDARILVFTASPLCRNPRVVKEATALGAAGYRVTVLTHSTHRRFEALDQEILRAAPFRRELVFAPDGAPWSRLRSLLARAHTRLARTVVSRSSVQLTTALGPAGPLAHAALRIPAELTILHTEIPLCTAARLHRAGRRFAVDMEDWYSEDLLPQDRRGRPMALLRRAEAFALHHSAFALAPSQSMADALTRTHACPPLRVIRNVFPLQPTSRLDQTPRAGAPRLIWFSQTIGPGRGLEAALAAWGQTRSPSDIFLLGDERPGYVAELRLRLPSTHRERLHLLSAVSPGNLPNRLTEFDLGLALEPNTPPNKNQTISNKLFQYLNAGLGVIAASTAGQREVFTQAPEIGVLVDFSAPTHATAQLDALLSDPVAIRRAQHAARHAAVTQFSWERESTTLLHAVAEAIGGPARPA